MSDDKPQPKDVTFTRFDLVAVAIPGAVFALLVAYEMRPDIFATLITQPKLDQGLGVLGLFAIAAFCVGNVLQAIAAFQAWINRELFEGKSTTKQLEQRYVADFLRPKYAQRLRDIGFGDPDTLTHGNYRMKLHSYVLAYVRRKGVHKQIDEAYTLYGLNRGLGAAFVLLALFAIFIIARCIVARAAPAPREVLLACGFIMLAIVTTINANRYARNFERELTYAFINDPERSPT